MIAADSGLHAVLAAGWIPDRLIGDLDSVDPAAVEIAAEGGAVVDRHPSERTRPTRTGPRCRRRCRRHRDQVVVRADGRLDHQLANLFASPSLTGAPPRCVPMSVIMSVGGAGERRLEVSIGQHLALLPIGGPARVTTRGRVPAGRRGVVSLRRTWHRQRGDRVRGVADGVGRCRAGGQFPAQADDPDEPEPGRIRDTSESRSGGSAVPDPGLEHGGVASALGDEFVVAPELDDASIVDHGDRSARRAVASRWAMITAVRPSSTTSRGARPASRS